jgi:hypothetical protein
MSSSLKNIRDRVIQHLKQIFIDDDTGRYTKHLKKKDDAIQSHLVTSTETNTP